MQPRRSSPISSSHASLLIATGSVTCLLFACSRRPLEASERTPRGHTLAFEATVEAEEAPIAIAAPAPREMPRVAELRVRRDERVRKGQILAVLEGTGEASLAIELARSRLQRAELAVKRAAQPFLPDKDGTEIADKIGHVKTARFETEHMRTLAEEQRIALRRAELRADRLMIRAPVDGVVREIHARVGEAIQPAKGLLDLLGDARIVRGSGPWKSPCASLRTGMPLRFRSSGSEASISGRLLRSSRDGSRCIIEARVPDGELMGLLGSTGEVTLLVAETAKQAGAPEGSESDGGAATSPRLK